jgi:hypothetical protein
MKTLPTILILTLCLFSCNSRTEEPLNNKTLTAEEQSANLAKLNLDFGQPVLIDSSVYVMYPLILENNDESERGIGSSSYGGPTTYWNIVFYNTENDEYHLLDENLKMVIYSYDPRNSDGGGSSSSSDLSDYPENGYNQVDRLLYYSITTTDFNKDGKLNSEDPSYLFISDKAGRHFKQISPDSMSVQSWQTIKGANKILMQLISDNNNDKKYTEEDMKIPMVFDLNKNLNSKEIFKEDFNLRLKKLLDDQWIKKE